VRHDSGPFLSRPMKLAMELATPERRTGLAAHDFEPLLGCEEVYLTRSERVDNAPTVPSRWLQRLTAICGSEISSQMRARGTEFLQIANLLDQPPAPAKRVERPCPKPPIAFRPKGLSLTEIETWIRDPYAIYARRILKLGPMGALGTVSEPALRGTILHDTVAEFIESGIDPDGDTAIADFISIVENQLLINKIPAHLTALWMPRFSEIARDFILFEQQQKPYVNRSYCEIDGRYTISDTGFELRGRADRIDLLDDGSVRIIDYKSGLKPTAAMARTLAPQLALEGAIVMAGGFATVGTHIPSSLEYVRLRSRGEFKQEAVNNKTFSAEELSCGKLQELEQLIEKYCNLDQGYLSRFAMELQDNFTSDYDHLARVREWSWGNEESPGEND
jgi:ATP-dependent helicase/nuclease subunit B